MPARAELYSSIGVRLIIIIITAELKAVVATTIVELIYIADTITLKKKPNKGVSALSYLEDILQGSMGKKISQQLIRI